VLGADDAGAPHIRKRIWILANTRGGRFGEQGYGEDQFSRGTEAECPGFDVAHPPGPRLPPGQPCACGEIRDEARGPESERRSGHVAHPAGLRRVKGWPESKRLEGRPDAIQRGPSIPHAMREGLEEWDGGSGKAGSCAAPVVGDWWATEPAMDRVAHGVAHRVDRLKAIGNGQVPQVAELAFRTLYGRLIGDTHE
jgi:DNA (cytosine-5)-methyltransferase 1